MTTQLPVVVHLEQIGFKTKYLNITNLRDIVHVDPYDEVGFDMNLLYEYISDKCLDDDWNEIIYLRDMRYKDHIDIYFSVT